MRYALVLTAAALLAPFAFAADAAPAAGAAGPPITFQTHPLDRVLDELRAAADIVGGEKAVKAVNKSIKDRLGEKGFEGLDLSRPLVGYVLLAPKPENITAVVALPIIGEKEFLALCDRANGEKHRALGKGLYQLPPLDPRYKARMRFSDQYAYIAYGANPEPALDEKALVPAQKLYDPAERAVVAARFHFDRLTPDVKLAIPAYVAEIKKELAGPNLDPDGTAVLKNAMPELEKMFARYALLLGGADTATLRLSVDVPASDVVIEAALAPKPNTELAKEIAARKPTGNRFAGLLTADTVIGFKTRLPFFNDELRAAGVKALEEGVRQAGNGAGPNGKGAVDELFKGLIRTVKTGEADVAAAVRGPDKDGAFNFVGAFAFEDGTALEKEFKKFVEKDAPADEQDRFKWDADKAGKVNIHTYKFAGQGFLDPSKVFGGDKCTLAFAFAPKGVFVVMGPDAVATIKDALAVKPAESPVLDVVLNPARMAKFAEKIEIGGGLETERVLGKEDKRISAASLRVTGGKELNVRLALNLRTLGRAATADEIEGGAGPDAAEPIEKK
ncbi:MAG: hypothetical protein J0I06_00565 [Planctomycetes bacterium]|nr:hypothetical protein [Planctomycetota bacterium]